MEILSEIIEVSNGIMDVLEDAKFFEENIFIQKSTLKRKLQIAMQRKWEQEFEMLLTDSEFLDVCKTALEDSISNTIGDLVDKGALDLSVNSEGEILYSANKDFDFDSL